MNKKYYIYAISDVITGGQELLHQLCDSINNKGSEAYIIYYPNNDSLIPKPYGNYNLRTAKFAEDCQDNVLILPEALLDLGFKFHNIQKVHWWLSVDNFFELSTRYLSPLVYLKLWPTLFLKSIGIKIKYILYRLKLNGTMFLGLSYLRNHSIINLVQSFYAFDYLNSNNFHNIFFLSDYLNDKFYNSECNKREDLILYNPKKGLKFTKKLIERFPEYSWVPIQNFTYEEVNSLMLKSKLYVDFGNHPGKDRMPREAVLSGMCVITGRQGAAKYFEDVQLIDKYKFDEKKFDYIQFKKSVDLIMGNFESECDYFTSYKQSIIRSKENFEIEVSEFLARIEQKYYNN
jgi:hypothetical protein